MYDAAGISEKTVSAKRRQPGGVDADRALFAAFLAGDDRALVALFDRHNERLYRYCLQHVRRAGHAEDITQELWERVLRLRAQGRATSDNPLGFFLRIARNLCLDALRRERAHQPLDSVEDDSHPTETIPELSHLEELVILALPHLPDDQREVMVLHEYCGYSYDEIATMLDETTGAIRTRAWRGRAHLGRVVAAMLGMRDAHDDESRSDRPEMDR